MRRGYEPLRMCVICRRRMPKKELMRYVRSCDGTRFTVDEKQTSEGRGWYVCDAEYCQEKFLYFRVKGRKR